MTHKLTPVVEAFEQLIAKIHIEDEEGLVSFAEPMQNAKEALALLRTHIASESDVRDRALHEAREAVTKALEIYSCTCSFQAEDAIDSLKTKPTNATPAGEE